MTNVELKTRYNQVWNRGNFMIKDITEFIFVEYELETADMIVILGSCFLEPSVQVAKLWLRGYANDIPHQASIVY